MSKIVGIDLGTTNSLVAVWEEGHAQLIPNSFGELLTPSVVSVTPAGITYVGKVAKERMITHPEETVASFKRFMGTAKTYRLGERDYKPEELSAMVLKRLKEDAERYLGEPVEEAVISVPAYFNDMARRATRNAGVLAGLKVERIINEPSAAALACHEMRQEEESTMLVFDFGGGTLDVSLVECFENIIEIKAVSGDNHLGGNDFDLYIAQEFAQKNKLDWTEMKEEQQAAILESANRAKQMLTEEEMATMQVTYPGVEGQMTISRKELINLTEALFQRMLKPIQKVLADAEIAKDAIDEVVLVGGSCKMPVVHKYIKHILKGIPVCLMNPDQMIAIGAGTYAGIKERDTEVKDMLLMDVCPFSLGTSVYNRAHPKDSYNDVIIERNSALPASREKIYYPTSPRQKRVLIDVNQGEALYAKDNLHLGELKVELPQNEETVRSGTEAIKVRFTYDINGILVVDVTIMSTGKEERLVIVNEEIGMSEEEIEKAVAELEKIKFQPQGEEENQLVLERAKKLYQETTGNIREEIERRMQYFTEILIYQNELDIKKSRRSFEAYLNRIEEYLQQVNEPWEKMNNFSDWYDEDEDAEEDELAEQETNQTWNGPYYTS